MLSLVVFIIVAGLVVVGLTICVKRPHRHGGGDEDALHKRWRELGYSEKFIRLMSAPSAEEDEYHKRPSDWAGKSCKLGLTSERDLPYGARVELTSTVTEASPYLNGLHGRYFCPREGPRSENWQDELVPAPFAMHYPLYLDIVYKRELPGRRIKVKRIELGYQGFYLNAYCYLRKDNRLFRLDCVSALITTDGQVFENIDEWVKTLPLRP